VDAKSTHSGNGRLKKSQKNANGEGSIYWSDSRKRWVAQFTFSASNRPSKFYKLKKDATKWLEEQKRMKAMGQSSYTPHAKMNLKDFLEAWLEHRHTRNMAPETYRNYKGAISRISMEIGEQNASKLSPHAIEHLMNEMADKFSESTCLNAYAVLSAAFKYAVKMGDFPINPVIKVPRPQITKNPSRHIPMEDFAKIYSVASLNPYTHARVEIGAIVGPRPGEILGLLWSDIIWDSNHIVVERQLQRVKGDGLVLRPVKQKTRREIPVTQTTLKILKAHKDYQAMNKAGWISDQDLIFPNTVGRPLDPKRDRKWWLDILKLADVPHYTLYQMRKTAFSLMTSTGTDIPTLLQYTGHKNSSTVFNHYAFSIDENMDLALKKLDSLRPAVYSETEVNL